MSSSEPTQAEKNARVARARADLAAIDKAREWAVHDLYRALRDAAPTDVRGPDRGVLTEVVGLSGFTRTHVTNIRDGKVAIKEPGDFPDGQGERIAQALVEALADD